MRRNKQDKTTTMIVDSLEAYPKVQIAHDAAKTQHAQVDISSRSSTLETFKHVSSSTIQGEKQNNKDKMSNAKNY